VCPGSRRGCLHRAPEPVTDFKTAALRWGKEERGRKRRGEGKGGKGQRGKEGD